jgi:predicted PurR-regulated permease PerM
MLGLDRRTLQVAWTLFLFVLVLGTIYEVRHTVMIFTLALFFAHLLAPVVEFIERFVPSRVPRPAVLALVYAILIAALVSALIPVGSRIAEQAAVLAARLPQAIQQHDPLGHLPIPAWLDPIRPKVEQVIRDRVNDLNEQVMPTLTRAGLGILSGIGSLLTIVLIPILGFFFLKDGAAMREGIIESVVPAQRKLVNDIISDLHLLLAQYIRALVILSMATLVFYFIALFLLGAPFPILLAGIAAALEFIPVVGPLTASVVILVVAAFTGYPHVLWIVIFLAVYRIFQDYVLSPYLMSAGVEIHPLLVLFGVLAGEQLAGIPGMFFSVPVMAGLRVILIRLRRRRRAVA